MSQKAPEVLVRIQRSWTPIGGYFRVASFATGFTFITNYLVGFFNKRPPISPTQDSQSFAIANITKSMYFGLIWPSILFVILKKPKDYFVLGGSFDKKYLKIDN